jgi:hypothetical protein
VAEATVVLPVRGATGAYWMFAPTVESQPSVISFDAALSWSSVGNTAPVTSGSFAS